MPIYEYQCAACDHAFDELQKMDADPLLECPACAKQALVKLVSAPSFRLKGSGWYETDFKQDKRRNLADDGNSSNDSASKSESDGKKDSGSKSESSTAKSDGTSTKSSGASSTKTTNIAASKSAD